MAVPSYTGIAAAIHGIPLIGPGLLHAMTFLMTNPWGIVIVIAAIVAIAILMAVLGRDPNEQEKEFDDLADEISVYDSTVKPLILSAAAFGALVNMGYGIDKPMRTFSDLGASVPVVQLNLKLANALTNADGSVYLGGLPTGNKGTNTPPAPVIVKGGAKDGGDLVLQFSNGGIDPNTGNAMSRVKTYALSKNMSYTAPSKGVYVPFFVNGKPNPEAVTAVQTQTTLLNAIPALSGSSAQTAAHVAGAAVMDNVDVTPQ